MCGHLNIESIGFEKCGRRLWHFSGEFDESLTFTVLLFACEPSTGLNSLTKMWQDQLFRPSHCITSRAAHRVSTIQIAPNCARWRMTDFGRC